ncbi:MAG: hemerythrin domain-containing protein [Balneolaceae bacterium]|nr:hemerythrin domain-containing protein [Balneolaceae bacterium]
MALETNKSLAELTPDSTISHIVSINHEAAEMLASIGLEPSEHMDETLRAVCKQRQWSEVEVLQWIKKYLSVPNDSKTDNTPQEQSNFGENAAAWCNYLKTEFHDPNLELLNEISTNFPRVLQIHGNQYPWLKNMQWHFEGFEGKVRLYFKFEEKKLFRLIEKLENDHGSVLDGTIRELDRCMKIIEEDQKQLHHYMEKVREKGRGFKNPPGACSTLRILNQNFELLFSGLNDQFKKEKEIILPLVQKKLAAA